MIKLFLLFLFITSCIPCYAEERFFSSKLINDNFTTLIVKGDLAIIRVLNTGQITATIEQDAKGNPYIVGMQTISEINPVNIQSKYQYFIPENKCYILKNLHRVCIDKARVITVAKYKSSLTTEADSFFNENNDECNLFKFDIVNKIFTLSKKIQSKQYQLATTGYPDFIKLIIVDYKQIVNDISDVDLEKSTNLRAFYVSSENDIGCIPYQNIRLYSDGEAQVYKMYTPPYKLVGQTSGDEKDQEPFLIIDKSRIVKYSKDLFSNDK